VHGPAALRRLFRGGFSGRETPRLSWKEGHNQAFVYFGGMPVPTEYGHRQVLIKAFVWEVVISHASEVIARYGLPNGRAPVAPFGPTSADDEELRDLDRYRTSPNAEDVASASDV
jgi:hypothetical protein